MNGEITSPAMVRALVGNMPALPAGTRPLMERFILMQPYAPGNAEASARKARAPAREMAGRGNFDTAVDRDMAPAANLIRDNINGTLTEGRDGRSPRIESMHLSQQLLPAEQI